ncbi:C2h2 conidiation transcription factor [Favolaschia claudopus]|uniref:C2h2 conidiation transcription factor n=1 Tax=Favolaschia claudopus TaxID=2862362 RepID=A0AAW0E109_9AGAR
MYHTQYTEQDPKPTLPSIGRIFDGAPNQQQPVYRRPSLTLPPLDNATSWRISNRQIPEDLARAYSYPSMYPEDAYRFSGYNMMPRGRISPESDPGRDALSSASSYSSSSSPYDNRMPSMSPYRPSSAPHLGAYRSTPAYHHSAPSHPFYAARPPSSAARHQCSYCNKRFNRPSGLKIHLTTHTGDKPFVCPEESCGRSFSVRSNMRRHVRIVHQLAREGSGEPRAASES